MSILSARDLHKAYGARPLLAGVTFSVEQGERLGLVGNNGSGKSTLARIIGGLETPDLGELSRRRGLRISTLTQVPDLDPEMTAFDAAAGGLRHWRAARDEHSTLSAELQLEGTPSELEAKLARQAELGVIIEQLGGWDREHEVHAMLEHLRVPDVGAKTRTLSGGEHRRVALAAALLSKADLLILDEPTNHLDTDTIDWLEDYLKTQHAGALLLVTHDRYFLDRIVTRTLELADGKLTSYDGGWESYLSGKAEREALTQRTEANRQNFLRREIEWLRRQPKARTTKQTARLDRAAEALAQRAPASDAGVSLRLSATRQGKTVVELHELGVEIAGRCLIRRLELIIDPKQRFGIIGPNGAGKTSLLRVVNGELQPSAGRVVIGKNTKVAYFDQTRSTLDEQLDIASNVSDAPSVSFGDQQLSIYSYLSRFGFSSAELGKKVGMLSGGERARVALAKLLLQDTNLLLLDEPTNDLDVATLGALEELLTSFEGSVLVVTHDRYFLNRVATDILAFEGQGEVVHVVGNYDTYKSLRQQAGRSTGAGSPRSTPPPASNVGASRGTDSTETAKAPLDERPLKLSYKEQRELDGLLELVSGLEDSVAKLEAELADPSLYRSDPSRPAALQVELERARTELERRLARWVELEGKREAFERR